MQKRLLAQRRAHCRRLTATSYASFVSKCWKPKERRNRTDLSSLNTLHQKCLNVFGGTQINTWLRYNPNLLKVVQYFLCSTAWHHRHKTPTLQIMSSRMMTKHLLSILIIRDIIVALLLRSRILTRTIPHADMLRWDRPSTDDERLTMIREPRTDLSVRPEKD
jgi:hypothetical protein